MEQPLGAKTADLGKMNLPADEVADHHRAVGALNQKLIVTLSQIVADAREFPLRT